MNRERYTSFAARSNGPDGKRISDDNPSNYGRAGVLKDRERERERKKEENVCLKANNFSPTINIYDNLLLFIIVSQIPLTTFFRII